MACRILSSVCFAGLAQTTSWVFRKGLGPLHASPLLSEDGSTVFIGSERGLLMAIDADSGAERWSLRVGPAYGSGVATPVQSHGELYVGLASGRLLAIGEMLASREPGEELWHYDAGGAIYQPAAASRDAVFVADNGGCLRALRHGVLAWSHCQGAPLAEPLLQGSQVVSGDGSTVFALDVETGHTSWRVDAPSRLWASTADATGTTVYAGLRRELVALNAASGTQQWSVPGEAYGPVWADGVVFVGGGTLRAVADGETLWNTTLLGRVVCKPLVAGGIVFAASGNRTVAALYALAAGSGDVLWSASLGAGHLYSSPVFGRDCRVIFVGTLDGTLHAISSNLTSCDEVFSRAGDARRPETPRPMPSRDHVEDQDVDATAAVVDVDPSDSWADLVNDISGAVDADNDMSGAIDAAELSEQGQIPPEWGFDDPEEVVDHTRATHAALLLSSVLVLTYIGFGVRGHYASGASRELLRAADAWGPEGLYRDLDNERVLVL